MFRARATPRSRCLPWRFVATRRRSKRRRLPITPAPWSWANSGPRRSRREELHRQLSRMTARLTRRCARRFSGSRWHDHARRRLLRRPERGRGLCRARPRRCGDLKETRLQVDRHHQPKRDRRAAISLRSIIARSKPKFLRQLGDDLIDATYFCPDCAEHWIARAASQRPEWSSKRSAIISSILRRSFFVGDKASDIECGRNAGVRTILVADRLRQATRSELAGADWIARDFAAGGTRSSCASMTD